jgi:segregation and condensation protein B
MASEAHRAIEAILMVADSPVDPGLLAQLLEIGPGRVEEICAELAQGYEDEDRGWIIARVAGGYRFQSHPDLAPYIERFVLEGRSARLSAAALETLAIIAYKQPVSRAQISAIRGVNADGVLRTLEQRGYVAEVARDRGPGQALLYGTTDILLERLGLDSLGDLPPLAGFVPGPEVMEVLEQSLRFEHERRDGPVAEADGQDGAGDVADRARLAAESAPGTDESGIDDFRAEDFGTDDFRHGDDSGPDDDAGDDHVGDDHVGDDHAGDDQGGDDEGPDDDDRTGDDAGDDRRDGPAPPTDGPG